MGTSSKDGGVVRHASPPHATIERITTRSQKQHPELSENRALWKSNIQGFKEASFIQTGGRWSHRDGRRGGVVRTKGSHGQTHGPTFLCSG